MSFAIGGVLQNPGYQRPYCFQQAFALPYNPEGKRPVRFSRSDVPGSPMNRCCLFSRGSRAESARHRSNLHADRSTKAVPRGGSPLSLQVLRLN